MTSAFATFVVNPTGRTSIPAAVRSAAGIAGETEMVAHVEGPGRIVIETRAAVQERIWAMFPERQGLDAVAAVRAMRAEDRVHSDIRFDDRGLGEADLSELDAYLAELGL